MWSAAESNVAVRRPVHVELMGIWKHIFIPIRRREHHGNCFACLDGSPTNLNVMLCRARENPIWRVHPQEFWLFQKWSG